MIVLTTVVHNAIFFFLGRAAGKNLSVIAGWFGRYRLALVLAVAFLLGALLLGPRLLAPHLPGGGKIARCRFVKQIGQQTRLAICSSR